MDAVESSDVGAAAGYPSWASLNPLSSVAPRLELMGERSATAAPRLELTNEQPPSIAPRLESMNEQSTKIAPRLGPMNEQTRSTSSTLGQPDFITVESADGVREQYIIKSEVASSEDEAEASLV